MSRLSSNTIGVAVLIVAAIIFPLVGSTSAVTVMAIGGLFAIVAIGLNLLVGHAGKISFGHNAFMALGAYTTGILTVTYDWPPFLAMIAAMVGTGLVALVIGAPLLRVRGHYLAMITLAFAQFVYFILLQAEFTGGENGMQGIPRSALFGLIDVRNNFNYYYVVLAMSAAAIFAFYRVVHSPFGEVLKAIRDNEARVESLGFDPEKFKLVAFTLSAAMAGLAGGLKATVFQFATLTDVSWQVSGEVILMTLLGGLGTLTGPMFGAAIIILMNDYLAGFGEWALIAQGCILLIVIVFFRRGFVGELSALGAYLKRRKAQGSAGAVAAPAVGQQS